MFTLSNPWPGASGGPGSPRHHYAHRLRLVLYRGGGNPGQQLKSNILAMTEGVNKIQMSPFLSAHRYDSGEGWRFGTGSSPLGSLTMWGLVSVFLSSFSPTWPPPPQPQPLFPRWIPRVPALRLSASPPPFIPFFKGVLGERESLDIIRFGERPPWRGRLSRLMKTHVGLAAEDLCFDLRWKGLRECVLFFRFRFTTVPPLPPPPPRLPPTNHANARASGKNIPIFCAIVFLMIYWINDISWKAIWLFHDLIIITFSLTSHSLLKTMWFTAFYKEIQFMLYINEFRLLARPSTICSVPHVVPWWTAPSKSNGPREKMATPFSRNVVFNCGRGFKIDVQMYAETKQGMNKRRKRSLRHRDFGCQFCWSANVESLTVICVFFHLCDWKCFHAIKKKT